MTLNKKLNRFADNPILAAHPDHPWEDLAVFNPTAWYDEAAKEVLLLYLVPPSQVRNTSAGSASPRARTASTSSA